MKVLVLNQPFIPDFCRCQRWPARTRARAIRPPDWLSYAAAVLKQSGFEVELCDFIANNWDKDKLRSLVKQKKPEFVVLDSSTPSISSDIECAKICKEQADTIVIMVGTHASALPEETLRQAGGAIDIIAIGEYDYTVDDIVKSYPALDKVKGIVFLDRGQVKRTPGRGLIEDLDSLPFPAWEFLDIMKYFDAGRLYPVIDIIGGRGCPYHCTFCQWPELMFGHKYRFRSAKNIVDEIEYDLKLFPKLKYGEFFFEDDTFTANKERAYLICEEISRRKLKITWSINARPDIYDEKLFKFMKKNGCREFLVGFESGVQEILDNIKKGLTLDKSREFVKVVKKTGLAIHGCFVFGLPGETLQTAQKTMDFALSLGVDTLQFAGAVPLPGTAYFNYCRDNGLLKTKSWDDWLTGGEQGAVVEYPNISVAEIQKLIDEGLKRFYLNPKFFFKFIFSTRNAYDAYRKIRGGCNFLSYLVA
jgi:anaerobic magnesium-protoporphyrin IX monomethyl ester cyclase